MNARILRRACGAALILALAAGPVAAQLGDNLSALDPEQAKLYLEPFNAGLGAAINGGVFRTGYVPKRGLNWSVDLKATWFSFSDKDRTYMTPDLPGYGSTEAPTVIGATQAVTQQHASTGAQIAYPGGFDMSNFATAVPQATLGSILGTRVIVRYIALKLGDDEDLGDFTLYGVGAQHSISQYLPGIPLDIAFGGMYQEFEIGDKIVESQAVTLNLTLSKRYGIGSYLEPYASVGLDTYDMKAKYEIAGEETEVDFDRLSDGFIAVGGTLSLAILKLHAEYRRGASDSFAGGISIGNN